MDDKVVQFDAFKRRNKEVDDKPSDADKYKYLEGKATCLACRHSWQCVSEVGETTFTCPECGLHKGIMSLLTAPDNYWECAACSNEFFMVSSDGCLCTCCGTLQTF